MSDLQVKQGCKNEINDLKMRLGKQFYICHMNEEYKQSVVVLNEKNCFWE